MDIIYLDILNKYLTYNVLRAIENFNFGIYPHIYDQWAMLESWICSECIALCQIAS